MMDKGGLSRREMDLICDVFRRHPEVSGAMLYGSRAKGTHRPESDVDLAIHGNVDALRAESIAAELDELPLPYRFEVKVFAAVRSAALREEIRCGGVLVYGVMTEFADETD
jgi:uncharacterized protein